MFDINFMLRHGDENATMLNLAGGGLERFDGSRFPGGLTKPTMQQSGAWHRMVALRCPIYLELARSESGQGLVVLFRALAPPPLETAAMPACRLSLLCKGVVRVLTMVCALAEAPKVGSRYEQNVG